MTKDNNLVDFGDDLDPAVVASISKSKDKDKDTKDKKPATDGRGKPGHSGQLGVDATGRSKKTFRLPLECQDKINKIAKAENLAQPEIIEFAVDLLHHLWEGKRINLDQFKTVAYSDKQVWRGRNKLVLPEDFELFSE